MPRGVPKAGYRQPRASREDVALVEQSAPPAVAEVEQEPAVALRPDPLQRGLRIEDMTEAQLRAYALMLGITKRDAAGLSVERLRANCKLRLVELVEAD